MARPPSHEPMAEHMLLYHWHKWPQLAASGQLCVAYAVLHPFYGNVCQHGCFRHHHHACCTAHFCSHGALAVATVESGWKVPARP